jgi:hypothetical protein
MCENKIVNPYRHNTDRQAVRWGKEEGHVIFAGRKVLENFLLNGWSRTKVSLQNS